MNLLSRFLPPFLSPLSLSLFLSFFLHIFIYFFLSLFLSVRVFLSHPPTGPLLPFPILLPGGWGGGWLDGRYMPILLFLPFDPPFIQPFLILQAPASSQETQKATLKVNDPHMLYRLLSFVPCFSLLYSLAINSCGQWTTSLQTLHRPEQLLYPLRCTDYHICHCFETLFF